MTTPSPIAKTITPIRLRTMTSALLFAHRLGEDLTEEHLLHIARGNKRRARRRLALRSPQSSRTGRRAGSHSSRACRSVQFR